MEWELFCEEQALDCEGRAARLIGTGDLDWLQLAEDWRRAAAEAAAPFVVGSTPGERDTLH